MTSDIMTRLEELRGVLGAENISYGELAELESLAAHIGDVSKQAASNRDSCARSARASRRSSRGGRPMIVYSDKLTRANVERIADALGLELHNADADFSGARRRRFSTTLRPIHGARGESMRAVRHGRRLWEVSWDGHYAFIPALMEIDPSAEVKSAIAHWRGVDDFEDRAQETVCSMTDQELADYASTHYRTFHELTNMAVSAAERATR